MSKFSSGGASRREALRATLRVLVASLTSPAGWLLPRGKHAPERGLLPGSGTPFPANLGTKENREEEGGRQVFWLSSNPVGLDFVTCRVWGLGGG